MDQPKGVKRPARKKRSNPKGDEALIKFNAKADGSAKKKQVTDAFCEIFLAHCEGASA